MKSVCLALIIVSIFAVSIQTTYGQRVYANFEEYNSTFLLANVINSNNAVDPDLTNYSTLSLLLGAGNLTTATQNLQFTGVVTPEPTAPLMIRFGSIGSVLSLFNGIEVQRTYDGLSNTVGEVYSSQNLADLLGLTGGQEDSEVIVPVPGSEVPADGLRLRIRGVLSALFSVDIYYAFFITPPSVEFSTVYVCQGESALISISNFQSGYTYRVYDALTEGTLIYSGTTDVLSIPEEDLTTGTYYLEAVEGDTEFTSSRTAFSLEVIPKPGHPDIIGVSDIMN